MATSGDIYLAIDMLNCLTAAIPSRERVVTCEEVFELTTPILRRGVLGGLIGEY